MKNSFSICHSPMATANISPNSQTKGCVLGGADTNQSSRHLPKFPFQKTLVIRSEAKVEYKVFGEYFSSPSDVHETRSQLHRAKLQNKPTKPLSQKDWGCVSVCCLCTVPRLRTVSPFVTVLWNLQMQALLATRGSQSRRVSWVAVIQPVHWT